MKNPRIRQDCQYSSLAVFKCKSGHSYPPSIHYQPESNISCSPQTTFLRWPTKLAIFQYPSICQVLTKDQDSQFLCTNSFVPIVGVVLVLDSESILGCQVWFDVSCSLDICHLLAHPEKGRLDQVAVELARQGTPRRDGHKIHTYQVELSCTCCNNNMPACCTQYSDRCMRIWSS